MYKNVHENHGFSVNYINITWNIFIAVKAAQPVLHQCSFSEKMYC